MTICVLWLEDAKLVYLYISTSSLEGLWVRNVFTPVIFSGGLVQNSDPHADPHGWETVRTQWTGDLLIFVN